MPSLVRDGVVMPILHVSQLASALELPLPEAKESTRLAWDTASILEGWLEHLRLADWTLLTSPTPSRGRTLRNLTVNVFHPFELLPRAWETVWFDWDPDQDDEREAALTTVEEIRTYAESILHGWQGFLLEAEGLLADRDPLVASPRGEVTYSNLLASQRWHAAFHYRQLTAYLRGKGVALPHPFIVESLADLELPGEIF